MMVCEFRLTWGIIVLINSFELIQVYLLKAD